MTPQGPVEDFRRARALLESAWNSLYEDSTRVPHRGVIHGRLLYRAMAGTQDIIHSGSLLLDAHREATAESITHTNSVIPLLQGLFAGELSPDNFKAAGSANAAVMGKLGAAYKAFFYVVRAYQDTVYRMVLNIRGEEWHGEKTTMSRALRETNPVGALLRDRLPDYLLWFADWREKRNTIKNGVTTGWAGPDTDLGLVFNEVTVTPTTYSVQTDVSKAIRLSDAAAPLTMSARVTELVHALLKEGTR